MRRLLLVISLAACAAAPARVLSRGPATLSVSIDCTFTNATASTTASSIDLAAQSIVSTGFPRSPAMRSVSSVPPDSAPKNRMSVPSESITFCRVRSR